MTTFEYLLTLTPEQAAEAVTAMSLEAKRLLAAELCGTVDRMAKSVLKNADEIWENR
jgi:hypothetical protein